MFVPVIRGEGGKPDDVGVLAIAVSANNVRMMPFVGIMPHTMRTFSPTPIYSSPRTSRQKADS